MFKTQAIIIDPINFNKIASETPFNLVTLIALYDTTKYAYVVRESIDATTWRYYIMPSANVVQGFGKMQAFWNDAYIK